MNESRKASSWKMKLALAACGVCCALFASEGIFRWSHGGAFPHLNLYAPDAELGAHLVPGRSMKLRVADNAVTTVRINAQGFRGEDWPAPSGEEILVVGDSQVLGLGVEESETFCAQLEQSLGGGVRVLNAGVPTYGPTEYRKLVARIGKERRPRRVVLTFNMANDLLEARRPNTERHAIWDGWAVRKETAPAESFDFPGKGWLFNRSHAVFELRRFLAAREGRLAIGNTRLPSEGVFTDLVSAGEASKTAAQEAEGKTEAHRKEFLTKLKQLKKEAAASEEKMAETLAQLHDGRWLPVKVQSADWVEDGEIDAATQLRAAQANPGDIVGNVSYAESGGPYAATAAVIRRGAELRRQLERAARARFQAMRDKKAEAALRSIDDAESATEEVHRLFAQPPERVHAWSPLKEEIEKTKAITDAWGADLTVLVLPFDVQVSKDEWAKYEGQSVDMSETLVLNDDVVRAAQAVGARGVHPFAELQKTEPGAFLRGDLHFTPRGHAAVAEALAQELKKPTPVPLPQGGLPQGRLRAPLPAALSLEALVKGSSAARCETHLREGWFRGICSAHGDGSADVPLGVQLTGGLSRELQSFRSENKLTFVLPFLPGDTVAGLIQWKDHSRKISLAWPKGEEQPVMSIGDRQEPGPPIQETPLVAPSSKFCTCAQAQYAERQKRIESSPAENSAAFRSEFSCSKELLSPTPGCAIYEESCEELLACANGDPWFAPECPEGQVHAGPLERCYTSCDPKRRPCSSGYSCDPWQGAHVCFPSTAE